MITGSLAPVFGRAPEPWLDFDPLRHCPARGSAAAATANPLASWAAMVILRQGGSAVDAAIAAQAMLTLVEPNASGIGGGALLLIHRDGQTTCLDGLSSAPSRVTARLTLDFDGHEIPADRASFGGRTAGVPGALRALETAHRRYGRLPWRALFAPAIESAEAGYPFSPYLRRMLVENPGVRALPAARALYEDAAGRLPPAGTKLRNTALAASLRMVAEGGADALHAGPLAREMVRALAEDRFPGTLTEADLAGYAAVERPVLRFRLGDLTVLAPPLPAYGGISAGQIAVMVAACGVGSLGLVPSAAQAHVLAEAGRLARAERFGFAEPDPIAGGAASLLDPAYLAQRAGLIRPDRCLAALPEGLGAVLGGSMTSHLCVADAQGMAVSMTTTINQNFGSRVMAGGFWLNNVLTNFAADPLAGGRADPNAMAPGRRARTTIAPLLVLDAQGRLLAALGAGGGYKIIGFVANALLRLAGGLRDPQAMLAAPHVIGWNEATELEPGLAAHAAPLARLGHAVQTHRLEGGAQALIWRAGAVLAGGDPRRDGAGMAM
jgi:gamma-glutamyltranspeptidase/glutathione hydrolase